MENNVNITPQEAAIQQLLGRFLKVRPGSGHDHAAKGPHPDQDSLAAFTEGVLSETESRPLITHLVDCSFCRHVTAELIRLDLAFADIPIETYARTESEPSKISEVLSGLLSKIFGTSDGAVFAHTEEAKEDQPENQPANDDEKN